jgi:hypothetical protein
MISLILLALQAGIALNLVLQFGSGILDYVRETDRSAGADLFQGGTRFLTALFLWRLFSWLPFTSLNGFPEYFFAFPLIVVLGKGLERFFSWLFSGDRTVLPLFSVSSSWIGQTFVALLLCLRLAATFVEALTLSFSFFLGGFLALFILRALWRRSSLERIPAFLRGVPLMLLEAGLLSLIFSALAGLLFRGLFPWE